MMLSRARLAVKGSGALQKLRQGLEIFDPCLNVVSRQEAKGHTSDAESVAYYSIRTA